MELVDMVFAFGKMRKSSRDGWRWWQKNNVNAMLPLNCILKRYLNNKLYVKHIYHHLGRKTF